jgi:GNAT superfamily N-acetyltransferase
LGFFLNEQAPFILIQKLFGIYLHLFLYCRSNRAIGLAILERRDHICRCTWEEYDRKDHKELERKEPIWSLGFAWVHKKHRRAGIARTLVNEAVRFLDIDLQTLGVYTPFSDDGEKFARKLFPKEFLVAK